MRGLIEYWKVNKKQILTTIGVLAFVIFIIQFINASIKDSTEQNVTSNYTQNNEETGPTEAVIDNSKISTETAQENTQAIKQFVDYCNQNNYQSAFNLLSSSCQKEVFNSDVNLFEQNYCANIFGTTKTYSTELWTTNGKRYTYEITYYENNLLATGGSTVNNNTQDYITVITENGETKLNINSFIYSEEINKTITQNNIEITINSRKVYKTYEKYNFTVKNSTANTISVSAEMNEEDICLVDENDAKYVSLIYEIPQHSLNIASGYQSTIELKFNKTYNTYREIEKISFQSIILNYEDYINDSDNEAEKIAINIPI